jgi:hypothetical protein
MNTCAEIYHEFDFSGAPSIMNLISENIADSTQIIVITALFMTSLGLTFVATDRALMPGWSPGRVFVRQKVSAAQANAPRQGRTPGAAEATRHDGGATV